MVHETIELWGRGEYRGEVGDGFAPSIETYVLDGGQRRGAVLICPGGGYGYLSPREAEPVALQFNAAGYHAFILSYSVAPRRYPLSLLDASKAICLLRSRADAWKIHPGRIALCGFSAGAHLAASLGVYWDKPVTQEAAPTATSAAPGAASAAATEAAPGAASAAAPGKPEAAPTAPGGRARGIKGLEPGYNRPDALILSYPVITSGPFAHRGSFENLLGSDPSAELLEEVSLELHVSEKNAADLPLAHVRGRSGALGEQPPLRRRTARSWGAVRTPRLPRGFAWAFARDRGNQRRSARPESPRFFLDVSLHRVAG